MKIKTVKNQVIVCGPEIYVVVCIMYIKVFYKMAIQSAMLKEWLLLLIDL